MTAGMIQNQMYPSSYDKSKISYSERLLAWDAALAELKVPMTASLMFSKWPAMILKSPSTLKQSVDILRATYGDDEFAFENVITRYPWLLGKRPLDLQQRVILLQNATQGEWPNMLTKAPQLLFVSADKINSNIRTLHENCVSSDAFRNLISSNPLLLLSNPQFLRKRIEQRINDLATFIPKEELATSIARAFPPLLFSKLHKDIFNSWNDLNEAITQVPTWSEEIEEILKDIGLLREESGTLSLASEEEGALSNPMNTEDSDVQEDSEETVAAKEDAYYASRALSQLLFFLSKPGRFERLQFLVETRHDKAGMVSILAAVTAPLAKFERRFGDYKDWRDLQACSDSAHDASNNAGDVM